MKEKAIMLCILIFSKAALCSGQEKYITFSNLSHYLGEFNKSDGSKEYVYEFINSGLDSIIIKSIESYSDFINFKYNPQTIPPGSKGYISVTVHPELEGYFSNKISVFTNVYSNAVYLTISGVVRGIDDEANDYMYCIGGLKSDKKQFEFGDIVRNEALLMDQLTLINLTRDSVWVSIKSKPEWLYCEISDKVVLCGDNIRLLVSAISNNIPGTDSIKDLISLKINRGERILEKEIPINLFMKNTP